MIVENDCLILQILQIGDGETREEVPMNVMIHKPAEREAQRVGVPCGPSTGLERDTGTSQAGRIGCIEEGVNAYTAGKVLGGSFAGRL